jgi:hypothetical protein
MIQGAETGVSCPSTSTQCPDGSGSCVAMGLGCPDFTIKRHDTKPPFKVSVSDCDGPLDLTEEGLIAEVNMWSNAKLFPAITKTDDCIGFADDIGFNQVMVGDIIVTDRVRLPEHMLVIAFDETNKLIQVQRGYNGTFIDNWPKGQPLKIFRIMNAPAELETITSDILQVDGTVAHDQVIESLLVYEWTPNSTCVPGCFWLEFKLLKMSEQAVSMLSAAGISITPSFTPSTFSAANFGCILGSGVEWERRFPTDKEGFLIQIVGSPTAELP